MFILALKVLIFFLVTLSIVNSQSNGSTSSTKPRRNLQRSFTEPFRSSVRSSPHMLQVFDTKYPSSQASAYFFQTYQDAVRNVGAKYPVSLGKALADAVYMTFPVLNQESFMSVVVLSVTRYLMSQNLLNIGNAEAKSNAFYAALLNNYPQEKDFCRFNLTRALSNGIVEFLKSQGDSAVEHVPSFSINFAKYMFAFTTISQPTVEVTVVSLPGTIPSADDVYGIASFTSTFMFAVDSSPSLKELFFVKVSADELGKAWLDAADTYCKTINCSYSKSGDFQLSIQRTYNFMSTNTYVKTISFAFAITLLEIGKLSKENSHGEAQKVVKTLKTLVNELPSTANLQDRLGVILAVLTNVFGSENNINTVYSAFSTHIIMEFYAVTPVVVHPDRSLKLQ